MIYLILFLPLLPFTVATIWAYGKLTAKVQANCREIDKKVDQPVCTMQHTYLTNILLEHTKQLNRIEEKIDGHFYYS